jgi:glucose-6-phosphate 1-dehydrogenase
VLVDHHPSLPYAPGTWGPKEADVLLTSHCSWHNPTAKEDGASGQ